MGKERVNWQFRITGIMSNGRRRISLGLLMAQGVASAESKFLSLIPIPIRCFDPGGIMLKAFVTLFFSLFVIFLVPSPSALADNPSCVHGLHNLGEIKQLGVKSVRWIITDREMRLALSDPDSKFAQGFKLLRRLKEDDINVFLTLRFPQVEGRMLTGRVQKDRVPQGKDRSETLLLVEKFLLKAGPDLNAVQLNNEPAGGPGYYDAIDMIPGKNGRSSSILWLEALSDHVKKVREKKGISHIKLVGPALTGVGDYLRGKEYPPIRVQYIKQLIDFSDKHMDFLDIHLHVRDVEQIKEVTEHVRKYTEIPFVTLEWSQARSAKEWFAEPVSVKVSRSQQTNKEFLESTHQKKISSQKWKAFLLSSPLDREFIPQSYQYMKDAGFKTICYSPAIQYGNPYFALTTLFVPRAVRSLDQSMPRNNFIYYDFLKTISGD